MTSKRSRIAVIGAGIGGLSASLRLAHAGQDVTVFETHAAPGGKMRTIPSDAGPIDAGPTVLTMKPVFDALFEACGTRLEEHVSMEREPLLARHFWSDGTILDLHAHHATSEEAIAAAFGSKARAQFNAFCTRAARLFEAFDEPMMRSEAPSRLGLTLRCLRTPRLIGDMAPHRSLQAQLERSFDEPKLAQLFGRYATYVGGRPKASPAILSLIFHAEALGVWHVKGGMHRLAEAVESLARARGAEFHYGCPVQSIEPLPDHGFSLHTGRGEERFDKVMFNGDPNALGQGLLGRNVIRAIRPEHCQPRSLSACVHSFAAEASGVELAAHNVFFGEDPATEFGPIANRELPVNPTLYICAQDRFGGHVPTGQERFEIIMNAPALTGQPPLSAEDIRLCQKTTFERLTRFGLRLTPTPGPESLATPQTFESLFPATNGALYGRSPHGLMAAFKRPTARSLIKGLYLVGGGAHPGAGVPMATLSAQHAAEAIITDLNLTSTSRQGATRGGMSTGSAMTERVPSRSSVS